jgi:hypothetical protein
MDDAKISKTHDDSLHKIRELLLQDEIDRLMELQGELEQLKAQVNDKALLIKTIDPVIVQVLNKKIHESKDEIAKALAPVMGQAIKQQVIDAREDVIDALYPVIGRMIFKAIAESMKKLLDSINQQINKTFNFRLWLQKTKAKVLGINSEVIVLAENAPIGLEELYLIEKKSGLLVSHACDQDHFNKNDAHVIGGMLTAIKSFVEDAFSQKQENDLYEIEYSEHTLRIEPGRYTYLAAVFTGIAGDPFDQSLQKCHNKIHQKYSNRLRNYNGDNSELEGIEKILDNFLNKYKT